MNAAGSPTRVALLTAAGRGAVASLAVAGPNAAVIVESLFRPASGRRLVEHPTDRIMYGQWAETSEDVVVARRGESHVEIHCHGGAAASQAILASLVAAGCEATSWQEFIAANQHNPIRATAHIALAECATQRTAAIVLDQYRGALDQSLALAIRQLDEGNVTSAALELRTLLSWVNFGLHLTLPWRVVIAGPPNVGKSTLINALVGFERAIVFDEPGTTRDVVTAFTAVHGWPVELADTAGLRAGAEELEAAGVARATAEIREANLVLLLFDVTQPWTESDEQLLRETPAALVVHNKSDLLSDLRSHTDLLADRPQGLLLSAKTGGNVRELLDAIADRLVPRISPPGAAIPFTAEQAAGIEAALALASQGEARQAAEELAHLVGDSARR